MELRSATVADAPSIAALHSDSWRFAYRGALCDEYLEGEVDNDHKKIWRERLESPLPNQNVFVLVDHTRVVAFANLYIDHDIRLGSFLNNLHVAQDRLRRGYGKRLMSVVRECCMRSSPSSSVYLWVVEQNTRARNFYSRLGARFLGTENWNPPGGGIALVHLLSWNSPSDIRTDA